MKNKQSNLTVESLTKDVPFEDVLPLILPMIRKVAYSASNIYGLEKEDLEQELTIKAYTSWEMWDPNGGTKYSTYVYDILVKHKNYLIRTAKAQRRNGGFRPYSLDGAISKDSGQGDDEATLMYNFCADSGAIDLDEHVYMLEVHETIEKVLLEQSSRAQIAIRGVLEGQTQEDIARDTGIAQSQISYYMTAFRAKLRKEFELKGFDLPATTEAKPRRRSKSVNTELIAVGT